MNEATQLLSWLQWIQAPAQKLAVVGSALFAGIILQRVWAMGGASPQALRNAALGEARSAKYATTIAAMAATSALWAALWSGLQAGSGTGVGWLVAGLAEGLCAGYCVTELRRTRKAIAGTDPNAESVAGPWLLRWRGQHRWLAFHAAWVPWLLVMSL